MKKSVIVFVAFCLAFILALGFIYTQANPAVILPETEELLVHAHTDNEYGTYNGTMLGDLFSGKGDFAFLSGEFYSGEWSESYMSGSGSLVFPGVGTYTGDMAQSKRNGAGTFVWEGGDSYEGNWENDAMSGEGTYTFANGCSLTGIFQENKPVSGTLSYRAQLPSNAADTEIVVLTYSFGDEMNKIEFETKGGLIYDGDVSGLYASGTADITYPSGNRYTGEVNAGLRNGSGTYTWKDAQGTKRAYYEGSWVNDQMNGIGSYHYSSAVYPYLQGTFKDGMPTGKTIYYKSSSNTFEATWLNGTCTSIKET